MVCPSCHHEYDATETRCPTCGAETPARLVAADGPNPDLASVSVFLTNDPAVLPLAEMTLRQAGIDYLLRGNNIQDFFGQRRQQSVPASTDTPAEILVAGDAADRARALLEDLERSGETGSAAPAVAVAPESAVPEWKPGGVQLHDKTSGRSLGAITEAQFAFLQAHLEREGASDEDYFIDDATLTLLADDGAEPELVDRLRQAIAGTDGIEIGWN